MEVSGNAQSTVDSEKPAEASGRSLGLDDQSSAKRAKLLESEEDKGEPIDTQVGPHSLITPSSAPEQKDGTDAAERQSGEQQQQSASPQSSAQGNMFGVPPTGLQGVAAVNYQGLLLLSQSQSGNNMPQPGALSAQQMWMNPSVLSQALGMNLRHPGAPASMAGPSSPSNPSFQGLAQSAMLGNMMQSTVDTNISGRPPTVLYLSCDDDSLSEYQCLVRKQIELFEARREDVDSNAQGRNRAIVMGQVGIRCRHCTMLPPKHRARGAMYYPAKLHGLYQAAQNMASSHLCEHCQHVPHDVRSELLKLRDRKSSAGGGKKYWADGVRVLGVFEDSDGLRFGKR